MTIPNEVKTFDFQGYRFTKSILYPCDSSKQRTFRLTVSKLEENECCCKCCSKQMEDAYPKRFYYHTYDESGGCLFVSFGSLDFKMPFEINSGNFNRFSALLNFLELRNG